METLANKKKIEQIEQSLMISLLQVFFFSYDSSAQPLKYIRHFVETKRYVVLPNIEHSIAEIKKHIEI